ncbi:hypothetical protein BSL78_15234, partial [Apostichopus japonicus]
MLPPEVDYGTQKLKGFLPYAPRSISAILLLHSLSTSVSVDLEMAVRSNEEKDKQGHSSSDYTGYHTDLLKRKDDEKRVETSFKGPTNTYTSHDNPDYDGDSDHEEEDPLLNSKVQEVVLAKLPAGDTKETTQVARTVSLCNAKTV